MRLSIGTCWAVIRQAATATRRRTGSAEAWRGKGRALGSASRPAHLKVIGEAVDGMGCRCWKAKCSCGKVVITSTNRLIARGAKSCGCAKKKHASELAPDMLGLWKTMINRCDPRQAHRNPNYGGRGIRVCRRWHSFANFVKDVGRRPSKLHSLDRKDGNGNYEPGNVRWATRKEQNNNARRNHRVTHDGKTLTISQWADAAGMPYKTFACRIQRGWSIERAMTQPIKMA